MVQCVHCGTPCGSLMVEGDGQAFCCTGCKTVYGILQHAGLDSFYTLDRFPGVMPRDARGDQAQFSFLDDNLEVQYEADRRFSKLIGCFSWIAIFIAGLGLYGLISYVKHDENALI